MTSTPVCQSTRTAMIGAPIDLGERFPVAPQRNIRRPIVAKQRFSRTAAEAAKQDGVDTRTVTVRRIGHLMAPVESPISYTWTDEARARATKFVMYALQAEFEGDNAAALSWAYAARCVLVG
jgi:hypothetical protein